MENKDKKAPDAPEESQAPEEELAVYEKFRQRVSKILSEFQGKINAEAISESMDKAAAELKGVGEYTKEAIAKARETLKKDIASTSDYIKPKIDNVSGEAKSLFERWQSKGGSLWREILQEAEHLMVLSRDKGGAFLVNVANGLSDWSRKYARKLDESLTYKTGEVTHGGEFSCLSCGAEIHLKQPGRLPPCPKCTKTEYRRS